MNTKRQSSVYVGALMLLALLGGCADKGPGSYVVLLRDPDGNLGKVAVKTPQGEQVLAQTFKGTALNGSKEPFFVMQDQLKRDFGAAMAAMPPPPDLNQPKMGFLRGTELTDQSKSDLQNTARTIAAHIRAGRSLDLSIIGHADSSPAAQGDTNELLGQRRANAVRDLIVKHLQDAGLQDNQIPPITTASHGETTPLPGKKPANPENKRVEITIR